MNEDAIVISVCIVTYKNRTEIGGCLDALFANTEPAYEVLLWDNFPADGTSDYVRNQYPSVRLFGNGENIGFGRANNALFKHARGRFFYLLNPDTEVGRDTLAGLVDYFAGHPRTGVVSTRIRDADGAFVNPSALRYPGQKFSRGELGALPGVLAAVIGASMGIRREVAEALGGFDEDFFLYGEDEDLCLRARRADWHIGMMEDAGVMHLEGASEKEAPAAHMWDRKARAAWTFYRKHYSAETCRRIALASLRRTRWRLFTLKFAKATARNQSKTAKNRVERDHARRYLKAAQAAPGSTAAEIQRLREAGFRFDRLRIDGMDNAAAIERFGDSMREQETTLMAPDIVDGNAAIANLHAFIWGRGRTAAPVVRFADGEYAYYRRYLKGCNGLYAQAESIAAIAAAEPTHIEALRFVGQHGQLCPLIYPGNSGPVRSPMQRLLRKFPEQSSLSEWLAYAAAAGVVLTPGHYTPFYAVYGYLCGPAFARAVDGRHVLLLNDTYNEAAARDYFARHNSHPRITHVSLPASYVATRWTEIKEALMAQYPDDVDIALVGAGAGALLVCADTARRLNIPAVDAGHFLNMLNDKLDKSGGVRLFTVYKHV